MIWWLTTHVYLVLVLAAYGEGRFAAFFCLGAVVELVGYHREMRKETDACEH